jgi:hypothetical protein
MHTMIANTLPPAQSLLVVLGFAALIGLLFLVVKVVSLKMGGWKRIAERFPMGDVNFTGDSFRKQEGNVGDIGSSGRGLFDIRLATEGVCVYPFFARRNPCLVPWSAIRRVSVSDRSLLVVVSYERTFEFFLPAESLPALQANLSPSLFHKAVSPFEAAKAAIEDKATPRWMAWVAGRAFQSAEKEVEKRKEHHDGVA